MHYHRDTIEILHKKLLAEAVVECLLSTFVRYLLTNVVKPKPEDWGTSLCKTFLNPELKIEALRDSEVKLETLLSLDHAQLKNGMKNSRAIITSEHIKNGKLKQSRKPKLSRGVVLKKMLMLTPKPIAV